MVVTHSEKRARKDREDRAILKMKKLSRSKQPKEFIASSSYKKYLKVPASGVISVDQEAVTNSAQWDGLHGVTNAPEADTNTILAHYRGLWAIEESFRIQKHDLKVRPIFHWTESRIRAQSRLWPTWKPGCLCNTRITGSDSARAGFKSVCWKIKTPNRFMECLQINQAWV